MTNYTDRRDFLKTSLLAAGSSVLPLGAHPDERLPVAAIITEYRHWSHADVIITKLLEGYDHDGGAGPNLRLAGMYVDQFPENDMARDLARKHSIPIFETIEDAITLGTGAVAVKGVLSIGEHGKYPYTPDTNQHMYPRRRFFDGIAATFLKCGQVVPVFNDKHLAYNWADAKHMYDTAQAMKMPFMAGSSIPVTWRIPPLELPRGCEIEEVAGLGYGDIEAYGFHTLEGVQCMVERRSGYETGVAAVETYQGRKAVEEAARQGLWSTELVEAALEAAPDRFPGRPSVEDYDRKDFAIFRVEYRDGLKATIIIANPAVQTFGFACKLQGEAKPRATEFELQRGAPFRHFGYLVDAVEPMIRTGKPSYPVERTLLTTGIIDAVMHSIAEGGRRIETPHLKIAYEPTDWAFAPGAPAEPVVPEGSWEHLQKARELRKQRGGV
ncbi:MAG: hypothetical protein O2968_18595 [Acidobacteria bacterium]|nr:hypothetical protein [Acidobacteriota bacterium]